MRDIGTVTHRIISDEYVIKKRWLRTNLACVLSIKFDPYL